MAANFYCLDCEHYGPRRRASRLITLALSLPALWSMWRGLAQLEGMAEMLPADARAHMTAFGYGLLGFFLLLTLPAIYGTIADRKRCAVCGHKRIVPANSPAARAAVAG